MRRFSRNAVCFVVTCAVAGCGSGQPRHEATSQRTRDLQAPLHAANDAQRATVGLLPRDAVPLRVGGQSSRRNRVSCGPRVLFRQLATAMATSPRYEIEGGQVQQTVLVFPDARTATRAFDRLASTANARCLRAEARSEVSAEAHTAVAPMAEQILNLEPRGQQSAAYRMSTSAPPQGSVSIDILFNRIGRALSSVSVIWTQPPQTLAFQEALVARIAARLQRTLA